MKTNQKRFAAISIVLAAIAVFVIGGAFWHYNQNQKKETAPISDRLNQSETDSQANIETVGNPSAASVRPAGSYDTESWNTYRNERCGFEIKYPTSDYNLVEMDDAGEFVMFETPGYVNCKNNTDPAEQLFCLEVEAGNSPQIRCSPAAETLEGETLEEYLADMASANFPVKKITGADTIGFEIESSGMAGSYKEVYFMKGDSLVNFYVAKEGNDKGAAFVDQIVSTFKFY